MRTRRPIPRCARLLPVAAGLLGGSPAAAHEFDVVVLGPGPGWCDELHARAGTGDVVHLLAGTYPGGCTVTLGGYPEKNEALLIAPFGDGRPVIEADADGLALRIAGEPTRVYDLELRGRVEIGAENATIDSCTVDALAVDAGIGKVGVLWSTLDAPLTLDVASTVVRGNRIPGSLEVLAAEGLVADNVIEGDAATDLPFHRNLVRGGLIASGDVFANVLVGTALVDGRFSGNTALGDVVASDARNNLTAVADLTGPSNLLCPACLADPDALDVRPRGDALAATPHASDGDTRDYCNRPRSGTIGAVDVLPELDGLPWTAYDRDRFGCIEGGAPPPPLPPDDPPFVEDAPVEPRRGCASTGAPASAGLPLLALAVLRRRTRPAWRPA